MWVYILRRLLALIPVLFLVSVFVFGLGQLIPGDPVVALVGEEATQEQVDRVRRQLELDRPLHEQYMRWLLRAVRGDLGESLFLGRPVLQAITERLEPTLMLLLGALTFAVAIGVPAGVLAAIYHNRVGDHGLMVLALLGVSIPNFWLGLNLILFFSVYLGWFPSGGYTPVSAGLLPSIRSVLMPSFALGFSQAALVARITRASMLEVLQQDYIRTAWAKGAGPRSVYRRHALTNAMLPTITVIGITMTVLVGGAVVTEQVFTMPGAGRLVVNAVIRRDYPVIQGVILVVAALYALINLLVDLVYAWIDPRIRYA